MIVCVILQNYSYRYSTPMWGTGKGFVCKPILYVFQNTINVDVNQRLPGDYRASRRKYEAVMSTAKTRMRYQTSSSATVVKWK